MKKIFLALGLLSSTLSFAQREKTINKQIVGKKFSISNQVFESHDVEGTDKANIQGQIGDYIIFDKNGKVYTYFDNKVDTMQYKLLGQDSLTFGDTPFIVTIKADDTVVLYQNEEEPNGDYNRVWYNLSYSDDNKVSLK